MLADITRRKDREGLVRQFSQFIHPVNDYSSSNIEQISKTIRGKNSNHVAIDKRGLLLGPGPPKVLNTYPHVPTTDAEFVLTTY